MIIFEKQEIDSLSEMIGEVLKGIGEIKTELSNGNISEISIEKSIKIPIEFEDDDNEDKSGKEDEKDSAKRILKDTDFLFKELHGKTEKPKAGGTITDIRKIAEKHIREMLDGMNTHGLINAASAIRELTNDPKNMKAGK